MCDRIGSSSARPGSFISAAFAIEAASSARSRLGVVGNSARKTKKFSKKQGAPTGRVGVEVLLEPTPDGKRHPHALEPALLAPQALDDLVQALDRAGHVGRAEGDRGEGGRVERRGEETELVDVEGAEARAEFERRPSAEVGQFAPVAAVPCQGGQRPGPLGTLESACRTNRTNRPKSPSRQPVRHPPPVSSHPSSLARRLHPSKPQSATP